MNSGDMLALTMVHMEAVILVGVIQIIPGVEAAKKWFDGAKSFLLSSHYENYNLDIETLGIRKVIYKKVGTL